LRTDEVGAAIQKNPNTQELKNHASADMIWSFDIKTAAAEF
jgi:hypothetical protein